MTKEEIFDAIRPIIIRTTGVPECILASPNAPAPSGLYAVVQPKQTVLQRGQANITRKRVPFQNNITVDVKSQIVVNCSVNFYRTGAHDAATKLLQANKRPDNSADLFRAGIGWNRAGPVNNLTALQSDNNEERAQVSIYLMYEETDPIVINSIESVTVTVENEKAEELESITVASNDAP
jgi:hypothetical protein